MVNLLGPMHIPCSYMEPLENRLLSTLNDNVDCALLAFDTVIQLHEVLWPVFVLLVRATWDKIPVLELFQYER